MQENNSPAARVAWIDFCRVMVAFLVIVRHVERYAGSVNFFVDLFNYRSLIFFFFLMAGYFAANTTTLWPRVKKLVVAYLFWAVVAALILVPTFRAGAIAQGEWSWLNAWMAADELGLMRWQYWGLSNVPLWFMRTLILLTLALPLLRRLSLGSLLLLGLACMALSDILCYADADEMEKTATLLGAPLENAAFAAYLPFRLYESVLALGIFSLGLALRHAVPQVQNLGGHLRPYAWWAPALSLALLPVVYFLHFNPPIRSASLVLLGVLTTVSLGLLCQQYLPRFCRAVAAWGPAAFFIYVTHYIILKFFILGLTGDYRGRVTEAQALWLPFAVLTCSVLIYLALKRCFPRFTAWVAMDARAGIQK